MISASTSTLAVSTALPRLYRSPSPVDPFTTFPRVSCQAVPQRQCVERLAGAAAEKVRRVLRRARSYRGSTGANLNKFEAEHWGEFGTGSIAQYVSAVLKKLSMSTRTLDEQTSKCTDADMRESDFSGSTFNGAYHEKAVAYKANFTGDHSARDVRDSHIHYYMSPLIVLTETRPGGFHLFHFKLNQHNCLLKLGK